MFLQDGTWQESLRALYLLEAMTDASRVDSEMENNVQEHFKESPGAVVRASGSAQQRVQQKAGQVLRNLGIETTTESEHTTARRENEINLLGETEETIEAPQTIDAGATDMDLLAGLQDGALGDALGGLTIDGGSTAAEKNTPPTSVDLFDTIPMMSPPSSNRIETAAGGTSIHGQGQEDPFGGWVAPSSQPTQAPDPLSLLGEVSGGQKGMQSLGMDGSRHHSMGASAPLPLDPLNFSSLPPAQSHDRAVPLQPPPPNQANQDALSAWHAATSGISSQKREDAAFDFIASMTGIKK